MKDSTREISPLRQRLLEDMRLRKLAPQTQASYVRSVRRLAGYLRRPPDTATVEELRNFQLNLVDRGTSPITLHATITGLKFFFDVTLDRAELMAKMKPVFLPRTLPVVLSREEVSALIAATRNIKHQTALSIAYGAGLRASEVISLKVPKLCLVHVGIYLQARISSMAHRQHDRRNREVDGPHSTAPRAHRPRAAPERAAGRSDTAMRAEPARPVSTDQGRLYA